MLDSSMDYAKYRDMMKELPFTKRIFSYKACQGKVKEIKEEFRKDLYSELKVQSNPHLDLAFEIAWFDNHETDMFLKLCGVKNSIKKYIDIGLIN